MLNINNQINKTPHALEFVLRFSRCLVLSYRSCTEVYLPFMQYCQTLQLQLPSDSCWEKNIYHKPQLARCLFLHLWHLFGVIYICLVWILWLGQLNTWCLHPHHQLPQHCYDLHVVMYSLQEPRNNLSIIDILKIQILKNPNISRTNFPTSVCNAFANIHVFYITIIKCLTLKCMWRFFFSFLIPFTIKIEAGFVIYKTMINIYKTMYILTPTHQSPGKQKEPWHSSILVFSIWNINETSKCIFYQQIT